MEMNKEKIILNLQKCWLWQKIFAFFEKPFSRNTFLKTFVTLS